MVRKKPEDLAEKQRIPTGNRKLLVDVSPPLNPTPVPVPDRELNWPRGGGGERKQCEAGTVRKIRPL